MEFETEEGYCPATLPLVGLGMSQGLLRWRKLPARVTSEQKSALARALRSRYRKLKEGFIYKIDGSRPIDFAEGTSVDLAMVLIGLTEVLGSRKAAIETLKEVIALFLYEFDPPDTERRYIDARKFDLRRQFAMLDAWQAAGTEQRLEAALTIAVRLLFGAGDHARGLAGLLVPDAQSMYLRTLHVFGRTAGFESLQAKGETHQPKAESR